MTNFPTLPDLMALPSLITPTGNVSGPDPNASGGGSTVPGAGVTQEGVSFLQGKFFSELFGIQAITGIVGLILLIIGLVSLTRYKDTLVDHASSSAAGAVGAGVTHVGARVAQAAAAIAA